MNSFLRWKFEEHSYLVNSGLKHSLILDFFSKKYRKESYERLMNIFVQSAISQGCVFSPNTPALALREIFFLRIYDVQGFLPEKDHVVLDVGANYGDSSIWWAKKFGAKVIAFEPIPEIFFELEKNIRLNSVDVTAYNVAIGQGEEIYGKQSRGMLSTGSEKKIKTKKLDSYHFDRVDLLKIDVEGFEYEVLNGAKETIKKFKPKIIIETHSKYLRNICNSYLLNCGYTLKIEGRTEISKAPGMDHITNLFYATV